MNIALLINRSIVPKKRMIFYIKIVTKIKPRLGTFVLDAVYKSDLIKEILITFGSTVSRCYISDFAKIKYIL